MNTDIEFVSFFVCYCLPALTETNWLSMVTVELIEKYVEDDSSKCIQA